MNIYGFSPYAYNQSDELAKQMFAQQALASSIQYQSEHSVIPQPNSMPTPSGIPWNVQGLSWGMPSPPHLVQFTGQSSIEPKISPVLHCKRKSLDVDPGIPSKQLITEEKMAAHLNSLHISSDYTKHSLSPTPEEFMELSNEAVFTEKLKGQKLVLSEELKKIREEPILPTSLTERLETPQMSLVVWKPRDNILEKFKENKEHGETKSHDGENNEESKKRNGLLVPELSGMDVEM